MNHLRVNQAAFDCVSRFKSSKYPLKNVADDIIKLRKLNSKERKALYDLVFKWMRSNLLINQFLEKELPCYFSLSSNEKDKLSLKILTEENSDLANKYFRWQSTLGDNLFLESLGPLIKKELLRYEPNTRTFIAKSLFDIPKQYLAFDKRFLTIEELILAVQKLSFTTFLSPLISSVVGINEGGFAIKNLPKKWHKHVWVMDAASQFIANLIKPNEGEKVLDMCTGLGGKLKIISQHEGDFYACDINEKRLLHAKKWLDNKKINYYSIDATKTHFQSEYFDWILLDAPCSGTGTIRRHPDIIYRLNKNDLDSFILLQKSLLEEAIRLLKVNGKLVYATCSILKCENEDQIENLLLHHKNISSMSSFFLNPSTFLCDGFFVSILNKN